MKYAIAGLEALPDAAAHGVTGGPDLVETGGPDHGLRRDAGPALVIGADLIPGTGGDLIPEEGEGGCTSTR